MGRRSIQAIVLPARANIRRRPDRPPATGGRTRSPPVPDDYAPLPPPEDIYSQVVVSVWNPKTATWTTKSYPPR